MAFLVYADADYNAYPYGLAIEERTEKAAIRAYVRKARGVTALPKAGEGFSVRTLGPWERRTIRKPKAEFELDEGF